MFDIEVRWPSEPFLWHRAQLWDLTKEGVVCSFKDGSLKETFFPFEDLGRFVVLCFFLVGEGWGGELVFFWGRVINQSNYFLLEPFFWGGGLNSMQGLIS